MTGPRAGESSQGTGQLFHLYVRGRAPCSAASPAGEAAEGAPEAAAVVEGQPVEVRSVPVGEVLVEDWTVAWVRVVPRAGRAAPWAA